MFANRLLLFAAVILFLLGPATAQQDQEENSAPSVTTLPSIPAAVHQAMQSRSFDEAVTIIDAAIAKDDQQHKDYLLYLKGLALTESAQLDQAIAAFEQLEKEYPESDWVSRARFGRAGVFVERRQYIDAGKIYRQEAERLLSHQRKDELAAIYLEFADRYYEGLAAADPSQAKQPDYKQALTYYREAVKLKPTLQLLQRLHFRIARCLEETDAHGEAIGAYERFLADYSQEDPESGLSAAVEAEAEARFRLGAVQLAAKQPAAARRTWQDLLSAESIDDSASPEVGSFLAKAEYRLAHTYGLPTPKSVGDLELGVAAAERFLSRYPDHELAPVAELEIAKGLAHHKRFSSAVQRLRSLIDNPRYEASKQLPTARQILGLAYLAGQQFDDAITAWTEFLEKHPTHPRWPEIQKRIVDAEYAKAEDAQGRKDYAVARNVWQTFLNKYPLDGRAPQILYQFGHMKYSDAVQQHVARIKEALDRGDSPQSIRVSDECEKLFLEAIADWRRLVSKYPSTNQASLASYMIGVTLEDRLGQLSQALDAYREVKGNHEQQARQRIQRLTTPQLEIVTERKFRSDEKPRVKLTTRNLEKVTVKVYRVDMTDYFRKMHLASGIETLDIALIDPDSQFEHEVAEYQQYRRLDSDVEIPVDGVGVTAVTVSSEKLEVTTMVVVSDLDVIVKSSRNELFLFAEDMRTGKPVAGASVLVSDGSNLFAEEVTDQDGVLQKSYQQLKSVGDLRVFAIHQGHVASTVNNLNGLDFAVGLTPRGYLYTDRPAYRAGQLVNVKGIIRWVDQDRFTFQPGEKFKLDIYDARGRQLQSKEVALNGYGTINNNLILPDSAPQGDYRVHLHRASTGADDVTGALSFETSFRVTDYRLEPVEVTIDLEKDVYYRGEKVNGSIAVQYYYGTSLANEKIQYSFGPDGEQVTATTDENGKIDVSFETQRFSESQPLTLSVQYPDRGISSSETVYLATRGFTVAVQWPREVYISGETFDSSFHVADPGGNPVETDLKVEVFRQTRVAGKPGEKLIETHQVKTDKKSGRARQTLSIEEGGMYLVRATGTDRFGNRVSGEKRLRISGDKDHVRLRILADKHAYEVGETAKVRLHWREQPALALVTFEGARVLDYRLVKLKQGINTIDVPMVADLAPNFFLSVAVMQRNRFHTAESGFQVTQRLKVTLKPSRKTLPPGEDLSVEIEVTDPQGNPLQAELSLALVQTNLLNVFGDAQGAIDAFFGAGERRRSVRQMTSCTFKYRPATRAISQTLLAEAVRNERLRREVRALADTSVQHVPELGTIVIRGNMRDVELLGEAVGQQDVAGGRFSNSSSGGAGDWLADVDGEMTNEIAEAMASGSVEGVVLGDFFAGGLSEPPRAAYQMSSGQRMIERAQQTRDEAPQTRARLGLPQIETNNWAMMDAPASAGAQVNRQQAAGRFYRQRVDAYYDSLHYAAPQQGVAGPGPGLLPNNVWFDTQQRDHTINALTGKGQFLAINGRDLQELEEAAEGIQVMPAMAHAETAFWDPTIVTDQSGKAHVVITTPARSTSWRLRAKAIDETSLAGEATADVITKKDLFGDLKLPLAFTDGDRADIPVDIHHSLPGAREIKVVLQFTLGDKSTTQRKTIDVQGPGISKISFPIEIEDADVAEFQLTVSSGDDRSDQTVRSARILPYGFPVYQTIAGTSSQSTVAMIEFERQEGVQNPSLEILIGSSVNRSLLESVLGGGLFPMDRCGLVPGTQLERSVSDVLGGVALLKMIGDARQSETPEAQALAGRITAAISQLISAQRDDGAWSWSGRAENSNPDVYLSSRVMWALAEARANGFAVAADPFQKGKSFLKTTFVGSSGGSLERQTILLHAMAETDCADFALANRLYRERNRLSDSGLVHLALALSAMNHDEMAADLLPLVKVTSDPKTASKRSAQKVAGLIPWMQSGIELRALLMLAHQQIKPEGAEVRQLAKWLMAARVGSRWPIEKANGPTIAALADWYARSRHVGEKYKMTVSVNNEPVKSFTVDPSKEGSRRIEVPDELLKKGKHQTINFDIEGRGRFSYSAVLSGFVPADRLQKTTDDWTVTRRYEPAKRLLDGRPVPRGFSVVNGPYRSFYNPLTQLPVGQRGEVTLSPRRRNTTGRAGEQYDYLVLTEPVPAGCTVLDGSVEGDFERYEIESGRITFYIGAKRYPDDIRYTLVGYVPGTYRLAQSLLRSFYDPSQMAIADVKELKVLGGDAKSADKYRLTPDELYHLGSKQLEKGNIDAAHRHLTDLLKDWRLDAKQYQNVVHWLFRTSLEKDLHGETVKYFEVIKEKYPSVEMSFEDILEVALSYRELAEYERSYLVYRSTVQASFERESQVAGFLNARGEFIRSVAAMERLLTDYPAEPYIATATYALAQEVYRRAPGADEDEKMKEAGLTRVHLINGAIEMLDHFVSTWPNDPADDQASFALATALIDLDQYESAIARCEEYSQRYPDSRLLDSYWYVIGYSHFELEHHQQALEMCEKVATATFPVPETGGTRTADNKWEAVYIMGQVYHSLGKAADAIMQYTKVKQRFADAAEAIDFFSRKEIRLVEVSTIKPNDAKEIELDFRNIPEIAVKVYRIDLMKFGLMQRNLDRITAINLAGIKPYHEENVSLGDGKDYRDRTRKLKLPLKEEGAYLVVCRGENLYASGLVLVSPLALSVAEDVTSGRVRVTVKDATNDRFVDDVHVKVIGSANEQFQSGSTDLRGLFVADDIQGSSTVIAQVDKNQYAFFRGQQPLQGVVPQVEAAAEELESLKLQQESRPAEKGGKEVLRGNIFDMNGEFQKQQKGNFDELLNNERDGFAPSEAF